MAANLLKARKYLKAKITNIEKYILEQHKNEDPIENILVRKEKLDEHYAEFNALQAQLEALEPDKGHEEERVRLENRYLDMTAKCKQFQNKSERQIITDQIANVSVNSGNGTSVHSNLSGKINLPKLSIPNFDGKYEQWRSFYDIFTSVIHKNETISNVEKFFYLRSSLKGEALKIIDSITATEENYNVALQLLIERYDNKNFIINAHIKSLFELQITVRDNVSGIRYIISEVKQHLRSLKTLKLPVEHWDQLLLYMILQKLDINTRRAWELQKTEDKLYTLEELYKFLEHRCISMESISQQANNEIKFKPNHKSKVNSYYSTSNNNILNKYNDKGNSNFCKLCNNNHFLSQCNKYLNLSVNEKSQFIVDNKLCFNCLKPNHSAKICNARKCGKCGKTHHVSIHRESSQNNEHHERQQNPENSAKENLNEKTTQVACCNARAETSNEVLLATVSLQVRDSAGKSHLARALLDSGSQSNFITVEFMKKLKLPLNKIEINLSGINNKRTDVSHSATIDISSRVTNYQTSLAVLILNKITCILPMKHVHYDSWNIPNHINFADPQFNIPGPIDLLIGAEIYFEILKQERIILGKHLPILQNTEFGFIIAGGIQHEAQRHAEHRTALFAGTINEELEKFWTLEEFSCNKLKTREELECETYYEETTRRDSNGNYIVNLPLKDNVNQLGDSYEFARQRFISLMRRLNSNHELYKEYTEFMQQYYQLNHMEQVKENGAISSNQVYYIPHHSIIKESSSTTRLRVVFDASMKTSTKVSLNDVLKVGPTVHQDIVSIVLRFRLYNYVFTADVEKMYRQIKINHQHTDLQRILWIDEKNDIKPFRLLTVTYGTASAPYLATKTLQQLASDDGDTYPLAKPVLQKDFYVDDVLTGSNDFNEILKIQTELIQLLEQGGFKLHKWCSNDERILQSIPVEKRETKQSLLIDKNTVKTLGLIWLPKEDRLKFLIHIRKETDIMTKRNILSEIASIYDPLGLLGPVITKAKLFMQHLWKENLNWDDEVRPELKIEWQKFRTQLTKLAEFEIDRRVIPASVKDNIRYEIHGFCDASLVAYGACVYLKCINDEDTTVNLICAKSRVAPIKPVSLPRLELCGALLLSRLQEKIIKGLGLNLAAIYLWTDSTIVIHWITSEATRWKMFIANRVNEIQELTKKCTWNHVLSEHNPADLISRGSNAEDLQNNKCWWNGPSWLQEPPENWPSSSVKNATVNISDLEQRTVKAVNLTTVSSPWMKRYSSVLKLKRVMANVLRFIHNTTPKTIKLTGHLTVNELQRAMIMLIKLAQNEIFHTEIEALKQNKIISKGYLKLLTPFLDSEGVMRVGGRLENLQIPYHRKHQIILPPDHHLTILLLRHEHLKLFHAGPQAVLANIREYYWPIRAKNSIKRITHECVTCFRYKAEQSKQLMGNLPTFRGAKIKAFWNTGIDYGGPFTIKLSEKRKAATSKAYIALFVCLTTRAIHLELVSSLSTESFLSALRRFLARRGACNSIYSDNATNFKGAHNQLRELFLLFQNEEFKGEIYKSTTNQNIDWKFIPPTAPHFGGIWEAGIKSIKYHIKRVVGKTIFTFEQFYTLLTQIESCVNSRPLYPMSDDPCDYTCLTPAHFLTGTSPVTVPEPQLHEIISNRMSIYQLIQRQVQSFWRQWSQNYLNTLQQRYKWNKIVPNVPIGAVVLMKEDNIPPANWLLGRVVNVHPGADNLVRVVTVKTCSGEYKRPITRLCLLPLPDNHVLKDDLSRGSECLGKNRVSETSSGREKRC